MTEAAVGRHGDYCRQLGSPDSWVGLQLCSRNWTQIPPAPGPRHFSSHLRALEFQPTFGSVPRSPKRTSPHISLATPIFQWAHFLWDSVLSTQFWNTNQGFISKEDAMEGLCVWSASEQCIYLGKNSCSSPDFTQSLGSCTPYLLISLLFLKEFFVQILFSGKEALICLTWVRGSCPVSHSRKKDLVTPHATNMEIRPLGRAGLGWVAFAELPKNKRKQYRGPQWSRDTQKYFFPQTVCYFIWKSIMAEVRILSDYLTLILWISTVFIFNAIGGMKYFTMFSGFKVLNLALAVWRN